MPTVDQTPHELVLRFVQALQWLEPHVAAHLDSGSPASSVASLVRGAKSREHPVRGRIEPGIRYAVHGSGCRFTLRDRSEVDVDITLRGEPKFDAWRVRSYARSVGVTVDLDVIGQALEELADAGTLTRHESRWFVLARPDPS